MNYVFNVKYVLNDEKLVTYLAGNDRRPYQPDNIANIFQVYHIMKAILAQF